jgi:protoporphyrinogen oxidase
MKIGIIGAGFSGLSAGYYLQKTGHSVTIFEKDLYPGGLAVGFKNKEWKWSLEKHYHHWFTNDKHVLDLAAEIQYPVITKRPKTSIYIGKQTIRLDSPLDVLFFSPLSLIDRVRMGIVLAFFKYNPFWKPLEKFNASKTLPKLMGKKPYQLIWEPLFINKFGVHKKSISLAWFWARITKRTPSLSYPKGGYLEFAIALSKKIKKHGGKIHYDISIKTIEQNGTKIKVSYEHTSEVFDKVIVTLPSFSFIQITKGLPTTYKNTIVKLKGLGAINLIMKLKEPFLQDSTYWLNICKKNAKIMSIVEHTNFMDKRYYNNEHIVYLGNYLASDHAFMKMSAPELLKEYDSLLREIRPNYKNSIISLEVFKAPFAQPIIPVNYSKQIPKAETPIKNLYLANMQQVYPWDRGTNYAVELGKKIAQKIGKE